MGYLADLEVADGDSPDLSPRVVKAMVRRHVEAVRRGEIALEEPLEIGNIRLRLREGNHPEAFVSSISHPLVPLFLAQVRGRLDEKVDRFKTLQSTGVPFVVALF